MNHPSRPIPFVKLEGCGNDYVYVDTGLTGDAVPFDLLEPVDAFARAISHRNYGIGSDGLIVLDRGDDATVRMRMWNADGSEGKLCLNGLRGAARYAADRLTGLGDAFAVATASGLRPVRVFRDSSGAVIEVEVTVDGADFRRAAIPALGESPELWGEPFRADGRDLPGYGVSVGNPHLVVFFPDSRELHHAALGAIGVPLNHDPRFPEGVNVHLAAIGPDDVLEMRSWERGSGATLACGSGAVAVYAVARRLGHVDAEARVRMTGGTVTVRAGGGTTLILRGAAREVFHGEWNPSPRGAELTEPDGMPPHG